MHSTNVLSHNCVSFEVRCVELVDRWGQSVSFDFPVIPIIGKDLFPPTVFNYRMLRQHAF